jgi:hypothetical protein
MTETRQINTKTSHAANKIGWKTQLGPVAQIIYAPVAIGKIAMSESFSEQADSLVKLVQARMAFDAANPQQPNEMPRPVQPTRPAPQPINTTALAAAIIKAGERRRAESLVGEPEPGSVAAHIIEAGKRRRGEIS